MEIFRAKNVATRIVFPLVDADGDLVTGATSLDSEIDQWADGANPSGFADCTNEATEIGSTGIYYLNLTQAEMNEDYIVVQIKSGNAKTQVILINTTPQTSINTANTNINTIDDFLDTEVAAILAAVDTEVAAIKAKTDLLPDGVAKNTALNNFMFMMYDSADHVSPKTGLTVTAQRSIDGGSFGACANSVTEVANGWYKISLDAADLNGDVIALKFTATGADATNITIKTQT